MVRREEKRSASSPRPCTSIHSWFNVILSEREFPPTVIVYSACWRSTISRMVNGVTILSRHVVMNEKLGRSAE